MGERALHSRNPHLELSSGLMASLQPEELQQQAGPADPGADPGALGQPASQPDQHQAELYAPAPEPSLPGATWLRPPWAGGSRAGGSHPWAPLVKLPDL